MTFALSMFLAMNGPNYFLNLASMEGVAITPTAAVVRTGLYSSTGDESGYSMICFNMHAANQAQKVTQKSPMLPKTDLMDIVWSGSKFVAVGSSGTILTSGDGFSWKSYSNRLTMVFKLNSITWTGSEFIAVGDSSAFLFSPDGMIWSSVNNRTHYRRCSTRNAILYTKTLGLVVGDCGFIGREYYSGKFHKCKTDSRLDFEGISYSGSIFVVVGESGAIVTSAGGGEWTPTTSSTSNRLYSITWSGSKFVAVGALGTILVSYDGLMWQSVVSGTSNDLYDWFGPDLNS